MAGKYAGVIGTLPRTFTTDPKHQELVEAEKAQLGTAHSPAELAEYYRQLRAEKKELDEQASALQVRLDAVAQVLADVYEHQGISSLRLTDGGSVSVQEEPYARVTDKEAFRAWCVANGLEHSLVLPWQTTNGLVKERLLEGAPEPDGVEVFAIKKLVMRTA